MKMLYNICTGIYMFGNNTYAWRMRRRSNVGHIFREKSVSYGPGNMVYANESVELHMNLTEIQAGDDSTYKRIILNKIPRSHMHVRL